MRKKWLLMAAVVLMLLLLGTGCLKHTEEGTLNSDGAGEPVDIDTLLSPQGAWEPVLFTAAVDVYGRTAVYNMIPEGDSAKLSGNLGDPFGGTSEWYTVSGHDNIQYLIRHTDGNYSLWKFSCFAEADYPYRDVLEVVYNIRSAADIAEIVVMPANMDNTAAGMELQKEIGTMTVTDEEEIAAVYDMISALTCYGENNWERIDLGDYSEEGMLNQVLLGRYLTLVSADGKEFNQLKYTGVSGTFYEYHGIAYSPLTAEQKKEVDRILKIETE